MDLRPLERRERLIQERSREAQAREEQRLKELREKQQARIDQLLDEASRFDQAETIRQYVNAVLARSTDLGNHAQQDLQRWATWARKEADGIDPTTNGPRLDNIEPDG